MNDIIDFFDRHADQWDSFQKDFDFFAIERILQRMAISEKDSVLDVGCGTGVLAPFLMELGVNDITAVDFSSRMIENYKKKFPQFTSIVANFENWSFRTRSFDKIIIFNTFPHFRRPEKVFKNAKQLLKTEGELVIAHSMNRQDLNKMHGQAGKEVEKDILISDEALNMLFSENGFKDILIYNDNYFFARGVIRDS